MKLLSNIFKDTQTEIVVSANQVLQKIDANLSVKTLAIRFGLIKSVSEVIHFSEKPELSQSAAPMEKPTVFVSFCSSENAKGDSKFSGGGKELNYLVKLLRKYGYKAHMVSWDGSYEPWLIDHQPYISIGEFRHILETNNSDVRCVTSWAVADAFIQASPSLYFWDMELRNTDHEHFPVLAKLYRQKIQNTASISRTIQAWHMAQFNRHCTLMPNFLDESVWYPLPQTRQRYRVGYMDEGSHTASYLEIIQNLTKQRDLDLQFQQIRGVEEEVLAAMRSCEVFLSMNIGKDPLWGEGCPRTILEAMSTGCVVIAFDIIGNREIIHNNFNSKLVQRYRPDLMAESLVKLYTLPNELERIRSNILAMVEACHTFEQRWPTVKEFLDL